ncbi:hypothetical protein JW926_17485 [Candidatus Sumerlaeota bacterium]|nr:hypothetical protein [Candidatus Sumerlaeota bacterium]
MKKLLALFLFLSTLSRANTVYVVLSSDTSIWWNASGGNDAYTYENEFDFDVFSNPEGVFKDVMDEGFRNSHTDSAGKPFKISWFMHGGGWFQKGVNANAITTTYLIKKYWEPELIFWGDEITYHFHHFKWNGSAWVMANSFGDTAWDFDWTMSQMIIDEQVYPISFRSGWNYMDNEYQNYLEPWIPFRMEGAAGMTDCTPYHPSFTNYKVPGDMKGWEARHYYMNGFSVSTSNSFFNAASQGKDQVVCIWSHQNEGDFIQQIANVDQALHSSWNNYPEVNFFYCGAKEAMTFYQIYNPEPGGTLFSASSSADTIVLDNDDGAPVYIESGAWTTSGSTGYNGGTYRFAWSGDASQATWNVDIPLSGYYDLSYAFLKSSNRVTSARFIVRASDGEYWVYINQNGSVVEMGEEPLGRFHFNDGATSITLDAEASLPSGGAVISDAVIINWAPEQDPTPIPTPSPTPSPTPTPKPTITPLPSPTPTHPPLHLLTNFDDHYATVTVQTSPDIYQLQPWVAVRNYDDIYSRMDTQKIAADTWRFSYDKTQIDTAVVSVCDIYGNVSMKEVRDGSRRITTQSEFHRCNPQNVNIEYYADKAMLIESSEAVPVLSQTSFTSSTEVITRSYWIGQTFIPQATGISRIAFGATISAPSRFRVEVRNALPSGFPDDNPDGLLSFSETALIETSGEVEATFPDLDGLVLDGRSYIFLIKILSGSAKIRLSTANPYPEGLLIRAYSLDWITIPAFDCLFRIYDQAENLSIDQSSHNGEAYITEKGRFVSQTIVSPVSHLRGVGLYITEALGNDTLQLQIRKALPDGFPDFSFDALLHKQSFSVSSIGAVDIPLNWTIPEEWRGASLAYTIVCSETGKSLLKLGHAEENPYEEGAMFVSEDLINVTKMPDNDLYFQLLGVDYNSLTSGTLIYRFDAEAVVDWKGAEIKGDIPGESSIKTRYRFANTDEYLEAAPWTGYYNSAKFDFEEKYSSRFMECEILLEASGDHIPTLDSFEIFYLKKSEAIFRGFMMH